MPRLVNGERKIKQERPEYAGKLLIFCEGSTEYNYFSYFKTYIEHNLCPKYSDVVITPINTKGNASNVYKYAEEFLENEKNARQYLYYEKHLVFDCDSPSNIQPVILKMKSSKNNYILDYSNLVFETWLVMHFQNIQIDDPKSKKEIYKLMRDYLKVDDYNSKRKAEKGTIGAILGSEGNTKIRAAIKNAKQIEEYWKREGKDIDNNIKEMNPSVGIYPLIERLLDEVIYLCTK